MAGKTCDAYCRGCVYYECAHENCGYILYAGESRGCDPGTGCTRKKLATKDAYRERRDVIVSGNAERKTQKRRPNKEYRNRMRLYRAGLTDGEIALELDRSKNTIAAWRRSLGLPPNIRPAWTRNE